MCVFVQMYEHILRGFLICVYHILVYVLYVLAYMCSARFVVIINSLPFPLENPRHMFSLVTTKFSRCRLRFENHSNICTLFNRAKTCVCVQKARCHLYQL